MNFFDNLYNLVLYISPYLPYTFFSIIVFAFGLLGILTYIFGTFIKKAPASIQSKKTSSENFSTTQDDLIVLRTNRFLDFFSLLGYFPVTPLTRSFVQAIQILRQGIGGYDFRYKLPWFLLLGAEDSGKSTLIQNASLPLPLGNPLQQKPGENRGCDWWFFDRAIVLDLQGSFLIHQNDPSSNNKAWKYFFNLLSHFHVRRPIDGIILTLPLTEFLGPTALDRDTLLERARQIYQKFKIIETKLGLIVPVYVVITKADIFKGFKDFANTLPPSMMKEIFGWSSPYQPSQEFDGSYVDEAFTSLKESLRTIQIELFSKEVDAKLKDGLMAFPMELDQIKEGLEIYLSNIFQDVGYRQAFFLRGIYFTGDTAWQPSDEKNYDPKELSSGQQPLSTYELDNTRHIAFVPSLLRDKIFPEYALAHPGKRRLIASSRAINITRVLMCVTFIFLSIGIFHAYKQAALSIKDILPFFQQVNTALTALDNSPKSTQEEEQYNPILFNEESKTLLFLMTQIDKTSLFTFFLPPSWSYSLSSKIQEALRITYEKIFFPSLYYELLNKIRTTIEEPLPYLEKNIETVELSQPLQIPEFLVLNGYVQAVSDIEKYTKMYNNLPATGKLSDLGEIVQYLFSIDLPESVYKNASFYEKAMDYSIEKQIPTDTLKPKAQGRLKRLFEEYISALLGENESYNALVKLTDVLNSLSSFSLNDLPQKEKLSYIKDSITQIVNFLSSSSLNWLNTITFEPGNSYDVLMSNIYNTPLFGAEIGDELSLIANKTFSTFKEKLSALNSSLTGPLIASQNGKFVIGPSEGLIKLQGSLSSFMSLPFMASVSNNSFQTDIPLNIRLFWSPSLVEKAVEMVNAFNVFTADTIPTYPTGIQETLRILGLLHMEKAIDNVLADAQSFLEASNDISGFSQEEEIRENVSNLKSVLPSFSNLLSFLNSGNLTHPYVHLKRLLENQATNLLQEIDTIFQNEGLYEPINSSFDTWDGQENVAFQAFGVLDHPSLSAYLDIQRERISYLVLDYAAPILLFLGANKLDLSVESINLLTQWSLILDQVRAYQQKKPSNSITLLQNFILQTMPTLNLSNCEQLLQNPTANIDGDFFEQQLENLRSSLLARCEVLKGQTALDNYTQIETFFNARLAGKFPFVGANPQDFSGYAEPSDIKAFFNIFSALSEPAKTFLQHANKLNISRDRAIDFLIAMDAVKVFFDGYLLSSQPGSLPSYAFDLEFRVFKDKEQGASQLLDWVLTAGSSSFDLHSPNFTGTWRYGIPVFLSLQWAANGPTEPMDDQSQKNLSVSGFTATFSYKSPWALLEMLLKQEAPLTDFSNFVDPNPQTLLFTIPTQGTLTPNNPSSIPAKVYMRLTLKTSDKNGGNVLVLPYFPDAAPILHPSKKQTKAAPKKAFSSTTTISKQEKSATLQTSSPSKASSSPIKPASPLSAAPTPSSTIKKPLTTSNNNESLKESVPTTDTTSQEQPAKIQPDTIGIPVPLAPSQSPHDSTTISPSPKMSVSASSQKVAVTIPSTSAGSTTMGIPIPTSKTPASVPVLDFLNTNLSL